MTPSPELALWLLALAAAGVSLVRAASPAARWLAFVAALAFAVVAMLARHPVARPLPPNVAAAAATGADRAGRTATLAAAAIAGPRAVELELGWRAQLATGPSPSAALGARVVAPPPLPFAPEDVRLRSVGELSVDRPALLELHVALGEGALPAPSLEASCVVRGAGGELLRAPVALGPTPVTLSFTPPVAGPVDVELRLEVDGHVLTARGRCDVQGVEPVLVVEPSGVAAAALRAQGLEVREADELPADWRRHGRIVLGRPVDEVRQQELVVAMLDGAGLFVLAPGFGPEGSSLRALLPVRPLPQRPDAAPGVGAGGVTPAETEPAAPKPEPSEPRPEPSPPPPEPRPDEPIGRTGDARPVSSEPVEVDKHAIAMVLLVDRSGSMGTLLADGTTRMSHAKTSAWRTASALGPGDKVGVVTFGNRDAGRVELPMTDATRLDVVRAGIERLRDGPEFTYLLSGLRLAHAELAATDAAVKHVVVVSDGEYFLNQQNALLAEADRMRRDGRVTLSMVSIIDRRTDPNFKVKAEELTATGGGQFFPVEDPRAVPVLVSAEVTRALSRVGRTPRRPDGESDEPIADAPPPKPEPREDPPPPPPPVEPPPAEPTPSPQRLPVRAVAESPLLAPDPSEWPTLGAALATDAPFEARVLLVAGDQGWPLLAFANRGLGRIGAFAADLGGPAGAEFRDDPSFPAWFAQWVAATAPADPSPAPRELYVDGDVTPPAPVPSELAWFAAVAGAPAAPADEPASPPAPVTGRELVDPVPAAAPWLVAALLLLALGERLAATLALRRAR